ncbi:hypothetical protein N9H93_04990 [Rhizobiaceae bacterium]|nr:hypothetical protein [Rhizobiaceae bacterium]
MSRLTAIAAAAFLATTAFAAPAFAGDTSSFNADSEYQVGAPFEESEALISFSSDDEFEMHEMNDAWLGMPVLDPSARKIGYVEDAVLDDDGELVELSIIAGEPDFDALDEDGEPIGADEANITVVSADQVEWTDTHIQLLAVEVAENTAPFLQSRFGE